MDRTSFDATFPGQLRTIRDYRLLGLLGRGGMGAVYKAQHLRLGRTVAVKILPPGRLDDPQAVARFRREVQAVGRLEHPHIVRALDAGEERGVPYLVMEYVPGLDLARLVARHGPLRAADACEAVRQAALGLEHAAENGLIHRDVKPSNLMLTPEGQIKILDLGLALVRDARAAESELTAAGQVMGTWDYMAPEQAGDSRLVDQRADVYSLGATLYKLLAGAAPFESSEYSTPASRIAAITTREPPPIAERCAAVSAELARVVHRMLARDPNDRFTTAAEAATAVAAWAKGADLATLARRTLSADEACEPLPDASWADVSTRSLVDEPAETLSGFGAEGRPAGAGPRAAAASRSPVRRWLWAAPALLLVTLLLAAVGHLATGSRTASERPEAVVAVAGARPVDAAFLAFVAGLDADAQVAEVAEQLRLRNPGFDGHLEVEIRDGDVTHLALPTDEVTDLAPLRALRRLQSVELSGSQRNRGRLSDLGPLADLSLTWVSVYDNPQLEDLTPLARMQLRYVDFQRTAVATLATFEAMSTLRYVSCAATPVDSLEPLRGLSLDTVYCNHSRVRDLSPLAGMPLTRVGAGEEDHSIDVAPLAGAPIQVLELHESAVHDLAPLAGMPLEQLDCTFRAYFQPDLDVLRGLPLQQLNYQAADAFWRQFEARQEAADEFVRETAPLPPDAQVDAVRRRLAQLHDGQADLQYSIEDGRIVAARLVVGRQADLAPLRALPGLRRLQLVGGTPATDLSPLMILPLEELSCDPPLLKFNAPVLRRMTSLRTINGHPAKTVLDEAAGR